MATMSRSMLGIWLFGAALLVLVACGRKDDPAGARPEDAVAMSKAAAETATVPAPVEPPSRAEPESPTESGEVVSDDAPAGDEDVDGDGREGASKRKRGKSKRAASRKRASSGVTEDGDERAEEPRAPGGAIRLKRIQFAHSVEGREPVDPEETFAASETDKLYAFLELTNDSKQKGKVIVTFIPPMGASSKVTLNVGTTARWRTWALRKSPKAVGSWKVIVSDESGQELGHRTFEVTQ